MIQELRQTDFSTYSMMDDFGRVFFHEGKVLRAIRKEKVSFCMELFNCGLFKELENKRLIPTTVISDVKVDNYGLVLEHEKLLGTLQHEWTFSMIKDAALLILEINEICRKYGYELKDSHLFNVLFRGVQPVWIDIGSFSRICDSSRWIAYNEFLQTTLVPLLFLSENKRYIGRKLLESIYYGLTTIPNQDISESELLKLLSIYYNPQLSNLPKKSPYFKIQKIVFSKVLMNLKRIIKTILNQPGVTNTICKEVSLKLNLIDRFPFKDIKATIDNLPLPNMNSAWARYHQNHLDNDGKILSNPRLNRILELITTQEKIKSILDLAGNEGLFSKFILENDPKLERIIISDYDENAINYAYTTSKVINTNKLHTVLLNFMYTPNIEGTQKRLKSDMVLALAITHHLLLTGGYSVESIFERIRSYSRKYVMIEFMPLGLWSSKDKVVKQIPSWYTTKWFRTNFLNYFNIIIEEKLEDNRILFYGEIMLYK